MTDIRVTQLPVEVLVSASFSPTARVTQLPIEVVVSASFSPVARVTQLAMEVLVIAGGESVTLRRVSFSINYT